MCMYVYRVGVHVHVHPCQQKFIIIIFQKYVIDIILHVHVIFSTDSCACTCSACSNNYVLYPVAMWLLSLFGAIYISYCTLRGRVIALWLLSFVLLRNCQDVK